MQTRGGQETSGIWLPSAADADLLLQNEFAGVRLSIDTLGRGPRLRIQELASNASALFDPVEISSLCWWPEHRRQELLQVGPYDPRGQRPRDGDWEL